MKLVFIFQRNTKRFAVYVQEDNDMNRLYLPMGLKPRLTFTVTGDEE